MRIARPGLVILAVLMVVTMSALVALSMVSAGGALRAGTDASSRRYEAEALVWSGVQIALSEIAAQRDDLLVGESADLTKRAELYQTAAGERAVVQLIASASGDPFEQSTTVATPLGACLNLNSATADMLATLEGLTQSQATDLVAGRSSAPYASVSQAAVRCGIDLDGIADRLCVVSCEPDVQAGAAGQDREGAPRVNVAADWSPLDAQIDDLVSPQAAAGIRAAFEAGPIASHAALVDALVSQNVEQSEWGLILDLVCFTDDPLAIGRIDILRADEAVLATIPGVSPEAARAMVSTRDRLSEAERRSISWPLTSGAVSLEEFRESLPWLTNRSMQFRLRLRAGFTPSESGDALSAAELRDAAQTQRLSSRVEWDVIIDAADDPPRVALIRDATSESAWTLVRAERPEPAETPDSDRPEPAPPMASPTRAPAVQAATDDAAPSDRAGVRVGRWFAAGGED